jgi:hypothetical protein
MSADGEDNVVVVGEKKEEDNEDKLVVKILNGGHVEVVYGAEEKGIAIWEYLSKRLYPAFKVLLNGWRVYWDVYEVSLRGTHFMHMHFMHTHLARGSYDVVNLVGELEEVVAVGKG